MASRRSLPVAESPDYYGPDDETTLVSPVIPPRRHKSRWRWPRRILIALLVVLVLLGVAGAAAYEDPALLQPVGAALLGTEPGTVAWNGSDPINVLIMGIDPRATETPNSDTMMVLHVDPSAHDVTMLSIPRDLYVTVPSPLGSAAPYGTWKINAAYAIGYNSVIGSHNVDYSLTTGAQYAQTTVESALRIPINYYAVVKFSGYQEIVDAMGGVNVCVPQAINDESYPAAQGYGYDPLHIKAGCQQMDGTLALKYARERHVYAEQDLGRIQAQQAILTGLEKKLLSPATILRAPAILSAVDRATITNIPHSMLPQLGVLMGRARGDHTKHLYLNADQGYVTGAQTLDGADILQGNWPKIRALVANTFTDPQLQAEHAVVQVRNGQHVEGLAGMYGQMLGDMGFNMIGPVAADRRDYVRDRVIVNTDRPGAGYTARKLAQMFQAEEVSQPLGASAPQVVLILGSDVAEGS